VTAYDAIVIGTGQAGPYVTSRLAGAGMKVAVIERNAFGGTCVNTGCIPTKTMVASAYAARVAARAAEYGVDVGSVRVDMKRVMARKDAVSKESRTGLEDWLRNMEHCTVYQGHARFESAHEVSEVFHSDGVYAGTDEPYLFGRRRTGGPDPERGSYRSFASFRDPDGNGWLFQEVTTRLAGRIDSGATTFASANDLAAAFRRAEAAHGKYEARLGQRDANWPEWYAAYMVAEQAGKELPS